MRVQKQSEDGVACLLESSVLCACCVSGTCRDGVFEQQSNYILVPLLVNIAVILATLSLRKSFTEGRGRSVFFLLGYREGELRLFTVVIITHSVLTFMYVSC
jgi:hypothetical protein